jgi:hypothetical protein
MATLMCQVGEDSADAKTDYASIESFALDVTNGTEDGELTLYTVLAGAKVNRLDFNSTETIFNSPGADLDFRVESDGNANMLFVDGGANHVNIGTATDLNGVLNVDGNLSLSGAGTSNRYVALLAETSTYAGTLMLQAGGGSSSYGAAVVMHGHAHATNPGMLYLAGSAGAGGKGVVIGRNGNNVTTASEMLTAYSDGAELVINEFGNDQDFRVESDTLTSALFVDGGTGNVTMQGATTTIGSAAASTNIQLILNGVASKAQRIKFAEGGVDKWLLGQGAASETSAFELYNAGGVMALSVDRTTNVATFASGAVFNEDSADSDFRVESDNLANALFIEGSNGEVTFGKNTFDVATVGVGIRGATGESFCSISTGNTLHVYDTSAGTFRFYVNVNGGISNYSANNINLSDEREKKNVEALPSQWDCLKHWDLKQFHYNADDDALPKKYGVIAQEIEAHCPEVIDVFKVDEDTERMGVKEQQMMWMAIKALQEAQTRIESLEARIAALES